MNLYIYIYTQRERERERERDNDYITVQKDKFILAEKIIDLLT